MDVPQPRCGLRSDARGKRWVERMAQEAQLEMEVWSASEAGHAYEGHRLAAMDRLPGIYQQPDIVVQMSIEAADVLIVLDDHAETILLVGPSRHAVRGKAHHAIGGSHNRGAQGSGDV